MKKKKQIHMSTNLDQTWNLQIAQNKMIFFFDKMNVKTIAFC